MRTKLILIIVLGFLTGGLVSVLWISMNNGSGITAPQISGTALIGGPFELTDHRGQKVTDKSFHGKLMLVSFGYTYCPDVCPAGLQTISAALDQLGSKSDELTPIFVTIDPERDNVKQLAEYVSHFHKNFVGLTGNDSEIKSAAKAYRVYYAKVKEQENSDTDYLMNHSSIVYLMDRKGKYLTHFSFGTAPDKMAERISSYL